MNKKTHGNKAAKKPERTSCFVDWHNFAILITWVIFFLAEFGFLVLVEVHVAASPPVKYMVLWQVVAGLLVIFQCYIFIIRWRCVPYYRVTFNKEGITVKCFRKTKCFIRWSEVKEAGIKYWTGADEYCRHRMVGQFIYFSDHALLDSERVKIGSHWQKELCQHGIAFFYCGQYSIYPWNEKCDLTPKILVYPGYGKCYPTPKITKYFPEDFFDFEALCKTCIVTPMYEGVECAFINEDGIKTYTREEMYEFGERLYTMGYVYFFCMIIAMATAFVPGFILW